MSDLATWRSRAAELDVVVAAGVWIDRAAPTVVLRSLPVEVLDYLVDERCWRGTFRAVLANPAVPNTCGPPRQRGPRAKLGRPTLTVIRAA